MDKLKLSVNSVNRIIVVSCIVLMILLLIDMSSNATYPTENKREVTNISSISDAELPIGGVAKFLEHDDNYEVYLEETLALISKHIIESTTAEEWANKHLKQVGKTFLNARTYPSTETESNISCQLEPFQEVVVIGQYGEDWYIIEHKDRILYVKSEFLSDIDWGNYDGTKLSPFRGRIQGPNGSETYYNLDMSGIVARLKRNGYKGEYWIREDGCKMFGDYIMVAANFGIYPYGSIVETSLGLGIVCDTGEFIKWNPTGFDLATDW